MLHTTGERRRAKVAEIPLACLGCDTRLRVPRGLLLHGGWLRCDQCHTYAYLVPFVGGSGLVFVVEIAAPEIHVLSARGMSQREVLRHLGILEESVA